MFESRRLGVRRRPIAGPTLARQMLMTSSEFGERPTLCQHAPLSDTSVQAEI